MEDIRNWEDISNWVEFLPEEIQSELEKDVRAFYEVVGLPYTDEWKHERLVNILNIDDTAMDCGLTEGKYRALLER